MKGLILTLPVVAQAIVKETGPHDAVRMDTSFELDSHTATMMREDKPDYTGWNPFAGDFICPYMSDYTKEGKFIIGNTQGYTKEGKFISFNQDSRSIGNIYINNHLQWNRKKWEYEFDGSADYVWDLQHVDPRCVDGRGAAGNSCGVHVHDITQAGGTESGLQPWQTTCQRCAEFGPGECPHFYDGPGYKKGNDPWTNIGYTAKKNDGVWVAQGKATVTTGTSRSVLGQVMVVHNFDGGRIYCGPIIAYPLPLKVDEWFKYGTDPPVRFTGRELSGFVAIGVDLSPWSEPTCGDTNCNLKYIWGFTGRALNARYTAEGSNAKGRWSCRYGPAPCGTFEVKDDQGNWMDKACTDDDNKGKPCTKDEHLSSCFVKNSCGLHVHQGTTCDTAQGGHFFTRDGSLTIKDGKDEWINDPWLRVRHVTHGVNVGGQLVDTAAGPLWGNIATTKYNTPSPLTGTDTNVTEGINIGRIVVLHFADGGRQACGKIKPSKFDDPTSSAMLLEQSNTMMVQRMDEMERRIAMMEERK